MYLGSDEKLKAGIRIYRLPAQFLSGNGCAVPPARITAVELWGLVRVVYYPMTVLCANPVCYRNLLCRQKSLPPY